MDVDWFAPPLAGARPVAIPRCVRLPVVNWKKIIRGATGQRGGSSSTGVSRILTHGPKLVKLIREGTLKSCSARSLREHFGSHSQVTGWKCCEVFECDFAEDVSTLARWQGTPWQKQFYLWPDFREKNSGHHDGFVDKMSWQYQWVRSLRIGWQIFHVSGCA